MWWTARVGVVLLMRWWLVVVHHLLLLVGVEVLLLLRWCGEGGWCGLGWHSHHRLRRWGFW